MYKIPKATKTTIHQNFSKQGEMIEVKVRRLNQTNEPITDGAPIIFTEREEGIIAAFDIRTQWEDQAVEAGDRNSKEKLAKRQERLQAKQAKTEGGGEQAPTE